MKYINVIDKGANGVVYNTDNGALKKTYCDPSIYNTISNIKEIDNLMKVKNHPFIINILDIFYERPIEEVDDGFKYNEYFVDGNTYILMEKADKLISENRMHIRRKMVECLLAVEYMHSINLVHGDIKPENIMLKNDHVKIIDLGLSFISNKQDLAPYSMCTPQFRAPEVWMRNNYNMKSDIFSLGCTFYELLNEKELFSTDNCLYDMNRILSYNKVEREILYHIYNIELNEEKGIEFQNRLLSNMLEKNPDKRWSATRCLEEFPDYKDYINLIRSKVNKTSNIFTYNIKNREVRNRIMKDFITIYENRDKIYWYSHSILIHAIEIVDRVLSMCNTYNSEYLYYISLYLSVKYFRYLVPELDLKDLFKLDNNEIEKYKIHEKFIFDLLSFEVYKETEYEGSSVFLTDEEVDKLILQKLKI